MSSFNNGSSVTFQPLMLSLMMSSSVLLTACGANAEGEKSTKLVDKVEHDHVQQPTDNAVVEDEDVILQVLAEINSKSMIEGGGFTLSSSHYEHVWLYVGSSLGAKDFYNAQMTAATSVTSLPEDGRTVYVMLWTMIAGEWQNKSYTYASEVKVNDNAEAAPKKVLVMGLDGVQLDTLAQTATPHLDRLHLS